MSGSEVAQIRETIAREYMAAKWGLTGEASGIAKHAFISARMKLIEEGYRALEAYVGDKALELVIETIETVPEEPTREQIEKLLRYAFGNTADTEYLIRDLNKIWDSSDLLTEILNAECARKMINALPHSTSS